METDPKATYIDSFSIEWNDFYGYAFSLFALIPAVLQKNSDGRGYNFDGLLKWPSKSWFSQFMRVIVS